MSVLLSLVVVVLVIHRLQSLPGTWPIHYHFAEAGGDIVLNCSLKAEKIIWKLPGKDCSEGSKQQKALRLHKVKNRCGGLYTCANVHNQNQNHSLYLLIEGHSPLSFSCTVDSYTSPDLRCSLTEELSRPSLIRVKSNRSNMDQEWTEMKIPKDGDHLFKFNVSLPGFCPFEEQVDPITVYVEFMSKSHEYIKGHKSFYLRDIVVPRAPEIVVTKEQIIWSNPWTHHPSFFPMQFQLSATFRNNTDVNLTTEEQKYRVKDVTRFSVRCRDRHKASEWSAWTTSQI
ncbi:uncharacterized protein LOC130299892 [Hyla sarda]|uniref:uncharacterized protein LOC130299892 n=1 Tax=Hyla sarda TaxID=327740 RepID=UPI0024C22793|nr:uncharacterized protein LOC130299892 [Hyla sarda]